LPRQRSGERLEAAAYPAYAEGMTALQTGTSTYRRAIVAFERAIALDPRSILPRAALVEACHDAWVATSDQKWLARGRDELARAEAVNADSLIVRLAAGRLHLVPGTFDRAVREYQRAIELEPASPNAWRGLARAYQDMGDHDNETAAAYAKAIEVQPGYFAPLINFGDFYRSRGNYVEAEKLWQRAIAAAPQLLAGHANLGGLYSDMGRYADAERELRRALDIEPSSRTVLNNLGALYQYMERDADAVNFLERARVVGPETDILSLNLGDSYRRLQRDAEATAAYRRGRELAETAVLTNPRDATRRAFLAYFALRLGDATTAEREIVQALNFGGENRTVLRRAVICFEALGQRDRAIAVIQSAPADVLRELNRQPDLKALRADTRFARLLPRDTR
jgi:tetratricopeptide (TPR) repeat protein